MSKKSTSERIQSAQQAAANCRDLQVRMQAEGKPELARMAAEGVDANLDRVNELKGRR